MLEARPDVWEENVAAYQAFWDLSPDRVSGFGEGFIPFVAVCSYADRCGYDWAELLPMIRAMDRAYLQYRGEKEEAKREASRKEAERGGSKRPANR